MTDAREDQLRNLLQKIAVEQNYDKPDIETAAIPTTGANFTSQLFYGTVRSTNKADINVFAKVAVTGESIREALGNFFDIETYFYTKLAKRYKELEDKYNVPEIHRLVIPKFYGCSSDYMKEVLVLQDLSKDGFVTHDRLKSIDWEYAENVIEQMAKFHALSLAHQKEYPEEYTEATKTLKSKMFDETGPMTDMFKKSLQRVLPMAREETRPKLQNLLEITDPKSIVKLMKPKKRPLIIHCDFKQSNLMHRIDENGKVQVVIVDYQTLNPGSVVVDLLFFIFTGSDGAFREKYYDQLIEHYYENLAAALRRLGLDPEDAFPRRDFDEELREALPFGLFVACLTLPLITIDVAQVSQMDGKDLENRTFEGMSGLMSNPGNDLCAARLNEVFDDYVRWGIL